MVQNPLDKPVEKKEEVAEKEDKPIGTNNKYGLNITRAFVDDFADYVGSKVKMATALLKEGRVTEKTIQAFLKEFPKYNKN